MLTNYLAACAHLTITVSEIERDICEKIVILSYPLHSTPPLGGFPSEYRHPHWYGKTRMVSLPDGEKISKICLFVLTWSTNVTDGRTDRRTDTAWEQRPRLCIALRGKNRRVFANYVQMKKGPVFLLTVYIYVRRRTQWAYPMGVSVRVWRHRRSALDSFAASRFYIVSIM